jgi:GNAT superfamily N-acetyltransferase
MVWPLGTSDDLVERLTRAFEVFDEPLVDRGLLWEAGDATGVAAWIPPGQELSGYDQASLHAHALDGGTRWDRFWDWVESNTPDEPMWFLDQVAVEQAARGRGVGSALITAGLTRARSDGVPAFLEVGNPRNVGYYERLGFRTVYLADAPDGGPHVWFMRWTHTA